MRYAEVCLRPGPAGFHPADREFRKHDHIERVAIQHVNQLDDGTIVLLYELEGKHKKIRSILDSHDDVLRYSVSAGADPDTARGQSNATPTQQSVHCYLHLDPNETVRSIVRLPQEHSLVIDTPIKCLSDGGIQVRLLAEQPTIANAIELAPDELEAELIGTGQYRPEGRHHYAKLTARQQEILTTAVELGYYETSQTVTHEDIATVLDLSAATVGEHLRKIEASVLSEIAPARARAP